VLKRQDFPLTSFAREEYARQVGFRSGGTPSTLANSTSDATLRRQVVLARGREEENLFPSIRGPGGAAEFFRERGIVWWSTTDDKDRPSGHMASSQISCANFLLPLAAVGRGSLVALLQAIDDDIVDLVPIEHERRRSLVELEWVGVSGPLELGAFVRGASCTSVDALLLGRTAAGNIRGYFLEWKYTESCGERLGPGRDSTRVARYADLYQSSGLFQVPLESVLYEPAYQLVRSLLLGYRTVREHELGVTEARTIVVCPDANDAYRLLPADHALAGGRATTVGDFMSDRVLAARDRFRVVSQRQLLDSIVASGASTPAGWTDYHRDRYAWR
jgi:hypothetical protein